MMFQRDHRHTSQAHAETYARYELLYTLVDFAAALLFVVGSIFFFYDSLTYAGTWLFLIGSVLFGCKPTIRLVREVRLAALGQPIDPERR